MQLQIDPKQYVVEGTGFHSAIGWVLLLVLGPVFILLTILGTYGIALIAWIVAGIRYASRIRRATARLRGSAVRVDQSQFSEIHRSVQEMSQRLGLPECPDVYVMEDNQQNAFALKHGSKRCVILIDDVVYGALATGNSKVLDFIVAHELAHHALGHTNFLRSIISSRYYPLSRLDELSCDGVANALVGEPVAARDALTLLLIGPQLFQRVDKLVLDNQAREVAADPYSKKSEAGLTHPLLLRRYARLQSTT